MLKPKSEKKPDRRQLTKGYRTIGGKKYYFKSRWEANYARYLQWLKQRGEIQDWFYEPETFWFLKIKRGTNNYTPDFKVLHKKTIKYPDGRKSEIEFVEVKGFMDKKSATKIKRMGIYHKHILLRVVSKQWFLENNSKLKLLIPDWETGQV